MNNDNCMCENKKFKIIKVFQSKLYAWLLVEILERRFLETVQGHNVYSMM